MNNVYIQLSSSYTVYSYIVTALDKAAYLIGYSITQICFFLLRLRDDRGGLSEFTNAIGKTYKVFSSKPF